MTTTKQTLLDEEENAWRDLRARFERVEDWDSPLAGDWSARDLLAHVACWHAELAGWLERWRSHGEKPERIDVGERNDRFHERCREMPLPDVRAMSAAARHRMREELAQIDDEPTERWLRAIRTCTIEHYEEHLDDLDEFLKARR